MEIHPKFSNRRFGAKHLACLHSWNFKGYLLILKPWLPGSTLQEISLNQAAYHVQIHGLPLELMTIDSATKIGKALGNLLEVEEDTLGDYI